MTHTFQNGILLACVFLSGCAPEHKALPEAPSYPNFSDFPASHGSVSGWTGANREAYASRSGETAAESKEFTLDQAIDTALRADPRIGAAMENIRQAEADLVTAGLVPNPDLSAGGSLLPLDRKFTPDRQGGPPQMDVGLAMPIDWFLFGKRAAAISAGQYAVDAVSADVANTVRLRIAATIDAFYDVLEAQAMLELAQENQKNLAATEKIILNRVAFGGVGTIEADRIKLSLFSSHRELHAQELNLAAALNKLRAALGIGDNAEIGVKGTLDVIRPAKPITIEEAFRWAEENRPDLIALRRQLEKTDADIVLEERKAYPQVTPRIGYTRQFQQQAIGFPDVNSWGAGVDVTVPLFDRNQGNIARAKSVHTQAQRNLQAQLVDLRAEIDQAVKTFASAYQFIINDDAGQLEAARTVRDKITQAYELGGKTLIEVLDAQRAYLETYRVHISAHSSYWHALYQLNAAIGKDLLH
ncbi:TolC family protein [Methylosarcina fibrata]|uniref:TolC family protein n=1 Tax=Methylosarcina fibrata TaxID=105972 RepID=UPI00036BC873|nr:TolC family protein [Methylosarcina fibrata]